MRKFLLLSVAGAAVTGALAMTPANAMPLGVGAQQQPSGNEFIQTVQARRGFVGVRPGVRFGGPRGGYWRGGAWYPGVALGAGAAVLGLGLLGAAAAANQPYYYDTPAPYGCYWSNQRIYDVYGRYIGVQPVQYCN